jgi:DNA-binding PadR family transcriptional regulator
MMAVMSMTRLLVLGAVRGMQPVHGYALRRELTRWRVDAWSSLRPGSIYHALSSMARQGLLEALDEPDERAGPHRPARIRYRLTPAGELEYQRLLHHHWWSYVPPHDPFLVPFACVGDLPPAEAGAGLRHRADMLRHSRDRLRELTDSEEWGTTVQRPSGGEATQVAAIYELVIARAEAEIAWCERTAERAEAGEFQ